MSDAANSPDPVPTDDDTAWPEQNDHAPGEKTTPTPGEDAAIDRDIAVNGSPD